ncbi:MAG: small multi-drug export protein [Candidatus Methanoperedens sp.]|nr:small multi-drug export protein [Candidatus Methanoperedens sp.]MCE8427619.1 small multi-drug export protein [Candidatus Methanoperedens sp.]
MLTILLLGTVSQPVAFATGLSLKLDPLLTAIMATLGAILGVLVILNFSERIIKWKWLDEKHYCEESKEGSSRICRIWHRYGVAGLGLLAPLLVGASFGTVIGIVLGAKKSILLFWMIIGIVIWCAISAFGINLGIAGIRGLWH